MARHLWATDRLWEGMVGGDDDAWRDGLDVLAAAQSSLSSGPYDARAVGGDVEQSSVIGSDLAGAAARLRTGARWKCSIPGWYLVPMILMGIDPAHTMHTGTSLTKTVRSFARIPTISAGQRWPTTCSLTLP